MFLTAYRKFCFDRDTGGTFFFERKSDGSKSRGFYDGLTRRDAVLEFLTTIEPVEVYSILECDPNPKAETVIFYRVAGE